VRPTSPLGHGTPHPPASMVGGSTGGLPHGAPQDDSGFAMSLSIRLQNQTSTTLPPASPRCGEGGAAVPGGVCTHRAPRGVTDVAVGDGFVDGKSEVCPTDVAHHLAVPPDCLQAEHRHLPARRRQSCHQQSPTQGPHGAEELGGTVPQLCPGPAQVPGLLLPTGSLTSPH